MLDIYNTILNCESQPQGRYHACVIFGSSLTDRRTTHPKFNLTRVRTNDLQVMDSTFQAPPHTFILTIEPSIARTSKSVPTHTHTHTIKHTHTHTHITDED